MNKSFSVAYWSLVSTAAFWGLYIFFSPLWLFYLVLFLLLFSTFVSMLCPSTVYINKEGVYIKYQFWTFEPKRVVIFGKYPG